MNRSQRLGVVSAASVALLLTASLAATTAVPRWQQTFHPAADGTTSTAPIAARELADGTVLVVTQSLQTVHYNHDGTIVSFRQLPLTLPDRSPVPGRQGLADRPDSGPGGVSISHAAIDGFGVVVLSIVATPSYVPLDGGIVETQKFDGLTGEALWPAPVFYDANLAERPTGVFLDRSGDVIVTGVAPGNRKHFTLKYDGRTGALLWGPMVVDNAAFPTFSTTASVDSYGNVYVSVPITFPAAGIATVGYSGINGSPLWGPILFPDPTALPGASLVTPDAAFVVSSGTEEGFVTLKYSTSSGTLLWSSSQTPAPNLSTIHSAQSLVADAAGDLLLSARFNDGSGGAELFSQKISGATGGVIWTTDLVATSQSAPPCGAAVAGNGDFVFSATIETESGPRLKFWRYRGADGHLIWGPTDFGPTGLDDPPTFFVGSNGRIFTSELAPSDTAVAALSSGEIDGETGVPAWGPTQASFPRIGLLRLVDLAAGPDDDPVVTGNLAGGNAVTLKYDRASGAVIWGPIAYAPANTYVLAFQVAVDAANDVFLAGYTQSLLPPYGFGTFLLKYSGANGAILLGPVVLDGITPQRIALDPAGNAIVLAWQPNLETGATHTATAKISGATGSVSWGPVIYDSGSSSDYGDALAVDAAGNALVVGSSLTPFGTQWFALEYSGSDGSLSWGPSSGSSGQPYSAAVDASGDLAASGNDDLGTMTTIKYSGATGSILWGPLQVSGGPGGAVAIAPNGDVVASGEIAHFDTSTDFATIRYKGSDGSIVWGPVVTDGEGHGFDFPYLLGLAFDQGGNVVLGGTSKTLTRNADVALVKYDGATGATLWGPVYVGGPDNEELAGFHVQGDSIAVGTTSEAGMLTAVLDESLGIQTATPSLPPAFCGQAYSFPFVALNGTTPYTWSIVSGSLPAGLTLSSNGILSGAATEQGTFVFRVRVSDAATATAERDFKLVVANDPGFYSIFVSSLGACEYQLSVEGSWTSYLWLPGGETTPTIDVAPIETTTYGAVVGNGSGCLLHLWITLPGTALQDPACLGPGIEAITPSSGPASGGTPVTIGGVNFQPGIQLEIGGQPVGATFVDPTQLTSTTPALTPGTLNSVVVVNPDSGNAALLNGFFADFLDVPPSNIFHDSIERLFRRAVTAGCDVGKFCPDANTSRAEMAVFLLKSLLGSTYAPPPATGAIFVDVYPGIFAADWIEDLYNRGIAGGCATDPLSYCPDANVTRAEMAVFLLKTLLGTNYVPPAATGSIFGDVSADAFASAWIEDLYNRGITAGCQVSPRLYCPDGPVTRGEMAAFLVLTFLL